MMESRLSEEQEKMLSELIAYVQECEEEKEASSHDSAKTDASTHREDPPHEHVKLIPPIVDSIDEFWEELVGGIDFGAIHSSTNVSLMYFYF